MRVLLDENLDWRLKRELSEHEVESVTSLGWAGTQNGELLRKAVESGFDVLMTMDGNMVRQQDLSSHPIAVLVLRAPSNRLKNTRPLMAAVLQALPNARKGTKTIIGPDA